MTAELAWLRDWTRHLEEELLRLRLESIERETSENLSALTTPGVRLKHRLN